MLKVKVSVFCIIFEKKKMQKKKNRFASPVDLNAIYKKKKRKNTVYVCS